MHSSSHWCFGRSANFRVDWIQVLYSMPPARRTIKGCVRTMSRQSGWAQSWQRCDRGHIGHQTVVAPRIKSRNRKRPLVIWRIVEGMAVRFIPMLEPSTISRIQHSRVKTWSRGRVVTAIPPYTQNQYDYQYNATDDNGDLGARRQR